jgi:hypothetical protein
VYFQDRNGKTIPIDIDTPAGKNWITQKFGSVEDFLKSNSGGSKESPIDVESVDFTRVPSLGEKGTSNYGAAIDDKAMKAVADVGAQASVPTPIGSGDGKYAMQPTPQWNVPPPIASGTPYTADKGVPVATSDSTAKAAATPDASTPPKIPDAVQTGLDYVSKSAEELHAAAGNMAMNQYNSDLDYWKAQGKYWMDPNADLMPDLMQATKDKPSMQDAYQKSGGVAGDVGSSALKGAAAGGVAFGAVGAGVGAVVGGISGAIKGIITLGSAKDADAEEQKRAWAEYEKTLQQWQDNRRLRSMSQGANVAKEQVVSDANAAEIQVQAATTRKGQFQDMLKNIATPKTESAAAPITPIISPSLQR